MCGLSKFKRLQIWPALPQVVFILGITNLLKRKVNLPRLNLTTLKLGHNIKEIIFVATQLILEVQITNLRDLNLNNLKNSREKENLWEDRELAA